MSIGDQSAVHGRVGLTHQPRTRPRSEPEVFAAPAPNEPSDPSRYVVAILSPVSPQFRRVRTELIEAAQRAGLPAPSILTTIIPRPGRIQAQLALEQGADRVIVAGGDGTVREVAGVLAGTGTPMAVVPAGSGNVFAHNLGLHKRQIRANVELALGGVVRPVDVGWATCRTAAVTDPEPQPFLCMAGIGRDAQTVADTRQRLKKRLGAVAYAEAGIHHLWSRPQPMTLQFGDSPSQDTRVWTVLVANTPKVPGNVTVFSEARIDDGIFNTLAVPMESPMYWLGAAAKGLLKFTADVPGLRYGKANRVDILPWRPTPVQLDGDVIESVLELRVHVQPAALRVICPPDTENGYRDA